MSAFQEAVQKIKKAGGRIRTAMFGAIGIKRYCIVQDVKNRHLTYLNNQALFDLYDEVRRIETEGKEGILIEAGCALGGSAIVIAEAKSSNRVLNVYDIFDTIPEPSEKDGADVHNRYKEIKEGKSQGLGGDKYYGYIDDLKRVVKNNFKKFDINLDRENVSLIEGRFESTIDLDGPVAFAHIDGDWYESVMTCLTQITPHLIVGGVLVVDDYYHWSGCQRAVDEYFDQLEETDKEFIFREKSRLHIVRTK
ncbi:asparagine synthase (glutamine-hydrolyzing) [Salinibacter ruber]|uniref:TylF/MycF family methyltransferase n=1 Tax=Salinibacter ruber TaxID=146919 RepID=UPI002168099B|nr:TylF/MycF family methyltransferase [Salinibacter ruber]MCS3940532.1 asparagine synthase (glutamine-hydrolyzing) [Salinibacter ruber]